MGEYVIRAETPDDRTGIYEVQRRAFGRAAEARLVDALREAGVCLVSLVAESNGELVGHVLFTRLPIVTPQGTLAAVALAPVAVLPERQRQGIGMALIQAGLDACRAAG